MTEISFYHLLHMPLERALPKLIEKVLESGACAVIRTGSTERAEVLNDVLWTYHQDSFIPHGTVGDGNAPLQPVWITPDEENPNGADILVLTDGAESDDVSQYRRCLEMFDGRDETAVTEARRRWAAYKDAAYELAYWQQTEGGGWERKA